MHLSHPPQIDLDGSSGTNSSVRIMNPRVNHEPYFLLIKLLFLPIQPNPASSAHAFSRSGEVSTQIFHSQSGI